jgi:hypothetical protein
MMPLKEIHWKLKLLCGAILVLLTSSPRVVAQVPAEVLQSPADLGHESILPRGFGLWDGPSQVETNAAARLGGIHLFRMPTALPSDPFGVDSDNDSVLGGDAQVMSANPEASSDPRLVVALGSDNPFFDFRHNSDPGGVGYYRLYSQYMFVDEPAYGASLGLQAWTPAGLEAYGLADGPTVVCPNFSWFYELGTGSAIHGFVSKDLRPRPGWTDGMAERSTHYGLALQSPCPGSGGTSLSGVRLFVEALGSHRADSDGAFQLLPGVHWQLRDNCWLAGGFIVPVSSNRPDGSRLWQLTCSWQF